MLTEEQRRFYDENGYVLVRGLLSKDEAARLREHAHSLIDRLSARRSVEATWGSAREVGGGDTQLLHCHNVEFHDAAFTRLITDTPFTDAAAGIIGPNIQLHHTKLFIKPPEKGSPFPMHQDYPFFKHERHTMIAAILHFDDAPIEKGCVRVVPGSHKLGPLEHNPEGGYHLPIDRYPLESSIACPAEAGDVLFFSYLTVHGSGVNTSSEARTTLLVQMRDPLDVPLDDQREPGNGLMLRGIIPAEIQAREPALAM